MYTLLFIDFASVWGKIDSAVQPTHFSSINFTKQNSFISEKENKTPAGWGTINFEKFRTPNRTIGNENCASHRYIVVDIFRLHNFCRSHKMVFGCKFSQISSFSVYFHISREFRLNSLFFSTFSLWRRAE